MVRTRGCNETSSPVTAALRKIDGASRGGAWMLAGMGISRQWPSLADQVEIAQGLFGPSGVQRVDQWVDEQQSFVGNSSFARTFSDHLTLPGIASLDYAHRHVRTTRGGLIGGIRFYSRNTGRPFVDVLAHSFDDVDALNECVLAEWAQFNVRYLRLRTKPGILTNRSDVLLDKSIHVARCHDLAPADGRVTLEGFTTAEHLLQLVEERYAHLAATDPALATNISPATPEDLRHWHARDEVWAVRVGDYTVGALAVAPGAIDWISGQEINEEVIGAAYTGNGYAASAQCAWAHDPARDGANLLIGTIDRHNHVSRATALRAGRPRILDRVFIRLTG